MKRTMCQRRCNRLRSGFSGRWQLFSLAGRIVLTPVLAVLFFFLTFSARAEDRRPQESPAERADQLLSSVNVHVHRPGGHLDQARYEKIAQALITLKAGTPFSEHTLKVALRRLEDSEVFEHIAVDTEPDGTGPMALKFDLIPFRLVKRVDIQGGFPLFEDEIMNALGLRSGDIFTQERLDRGKQQLLALFKNQGFIDPALDLSVGQDAADGNVALTAKISRRSHYRLKDVIISGNQHFSDSAIRSRMETWRASLWPGVTGRFLARDLKRDIRDLTARYRSSGFASVEIKQRVDENAVGGEVTVVIDIKEGPRFDVVFEGNQHFSDRKLKKELVLFKKGYRHGFSLRRGVRRIREKYRQAGYPQVRVTSETEDRADTGGRVRQVMIRIDEGPLQSVSALGISGNESIDDQSLRKQMLTVADTDKEKKGFRPQVLEEDVQAIEALYRHRGFTKISVQADVKHHTDANTVDIAIQIDEGVSSQVASVDITGLPEASLDKVRSRLQVRIGEPFRPDLMPKDKASIVALVSEKGYPRAEVTQDVVFDQGGSAAHVVYRVKPGPRARLTDVFIRGNFKTRQKMILRTLKFKPGDLFSLKKMLVSQSNLRNLDIFRNVRMQPVGLQEKDRDIVLIVSVGEHKPYFVEIGAGYDTRRGLFGLLTAGNRNLWGSGLSSQFHLFGSQIGYGGNLRFSKPYVWGTRFSADGRFFGEHMEEFNQSFGTESYGATIGVTRRDWYDFTFGANAGYQRRKQFEVDDFPIKSSELEPRNVANTLVFLNYDTRDSFLRPRKGIFSQASIDFSYGLDDDLDDFFRYRLDTRYFWTPLSRLTFAMAARGGYIDMYGSAASPADDQLFYLGGIADVRGFSENLLRRDPAGKAVGGRTMLSGTLEARIDLRYSFELVTFLDTGMIGHPSDPDSQGGLRFTTGLGLNYITPIGPIGISYGYKLDRREGEDPGRFHFSIGYTF